MGWHSKILPIILNRSEVDDKLLANVIDGADIRMIEGRGSLRLTLEARQRLGIVGNVLAKT
jgi:hypothetical protein